MLFERPQEIRSDIRLTRRAVKQRWAIDPKRGEQILEKVSRQALGEEPSPAFTTAQLLATARLHLDVQRMNQVDEHHAERLDLAERALEAKSAGLNGSLAGVKLEAEGAGRSSVTIYLPDNGRSRPMDDDVRPEDLLQD